MQQKYNRQKEREDGFTLIELLIFIAIFSIAMVGFIGVLIAVTRVQVTQASRGEVEQQSQFLLQQFQYYIQGARLVDMTLDSAANALQLREATSSIDPIIIAASNGVVTLQQGNGSAQALTSAKVTVSNLSFTPHFNIGQYASAYGSESVSYSFTMAASTTNPEMEYSQTVQSSVTLLTPVPKIALVQKAQADDAGTGITTVSSTYPTGNETGDLLLAVISNTGTSTATTSLSQVGSSTWTQIVNATYPAYNQETTIYDVTNYNPGLVGWWKLDDASGATSTDSSGNGNDGTLTGSPLPTWTTNGNGQINGALTFTGTSQYVNVPDAPSLQLSGSWTVSSWVKIYALPTSGSQITMLEKTAPPGVNYFLDLENNGWTAGLGWIVWFQDTIGNPGIAKYIPASVNLNIWYHLVGVWDSSSGNLYLYLNGQLVATNHPSIVPSSAGGEPLTIGDPTNRYDQEATIDDVRVYNVALTASQVQWLYAYDTPGGDSVTAKFGASVTNPSLFLYEYRGASTSSPLDSSSTQNVSDSATPSSGSSHPTSSVELVFGALYSSPFTETPMAGSGFTLEATSSVSQSVMEDENVYVTGPVSAGWTYSETTPSSSATMVTFK
jgi:prepilin-type N-terminal cleavage/methylation domain-containing protein